MAKKKITEETEGSEEVVENTEEAEAAKAAEKEAKVAAKAEAKAKKEAEKIAAKAAKEALKKNGELPPREGTKCALVWDTATAMSEAQSAAIDGKSLQEALPNINVHTVKTQYARWRKYHGISGRIASPKVEEEAETTETAE